MIKQAMVMMLIASVEGQSCDPPCQNFGTCVANNVCHCGTTYSGSDCSDRQCESSICFNGGTCVATSLDFFCRCPSNTSGSNCQFRDNFIIGPTTPPPPPAPPVHSPRDFRAIATSSTSIIALWSTVYPIPISGDIILYELSFESLDHAIAEDDETAINTTVNRVVMLDDLRIFSRYRFRLRAYSNGGPGPYSSPRIISTLEEVPSLPPLDLRNVSVSSTEIQLRWEHVPPEAHNGILTQYEVRYESLNEFNEPIPPGIMNKNVTPTTSNTTLTNLEEYVTYNISIRAYTGAGPSGYSDPIDVMTLEDVPGVVSNVTLRSRFTEIFLSWKKPRDPNGIITSYEITYRINGSDVLTNSTSSTVTNLTIESLTPNTLLSNVTIRGLTNIGLGDRFISPDIYTLPPLVVTNISVAILSSIFVRVSWNGVTHPQIRVIDYVVYYREIGAGVDSEQSLNTSFTESSLDIRDLIPESSYQFQVGVRVEVNGDLVRGERSGLERTLRYRVIDITWMSSFVFVIFSWTKPEDRAGIIVGYEIMYRVNNSIDIITAILETNSFTVTSLTPNTQLSNITVRTLTIFGQGESYRFPDVFTLPPLILSKIKLENNMSSTSVRVSWEILVHPMIGIVSHIIYYSERDLNVREPNDERSFIVSGSVSSVVIRKLAGLKNYLEVVIIAVVHGELVIGMRSDSVMYDGLPFSPSSSPIRRTEATGGAIGTIVLTCALISIGAFILWRKYRYVSIKLDEEESKDFLAPTIEGFPRTPIQITLGQGLKIKIVTVGTPGPSLQWHRNNIILAPTSSVKILSDGSLSISSVKREHKGSYMLTATNHRGKAKGKMKLTTHAPSAIPDSDQAEKGKEVLFYVIRVSGGIIKEEGEALDVVQENTSVTPLVRKTKEVRARVKASIISLMNESRHVTKNKRWLTESVVGEIEELLNEVIVLAHGVPHVPASSSDKHDDNDDGGGGASSMAPQLDRSKSGNVTSEQFELPMEPNKNVSSVDNGALRGSVVSGQFDCSRDEFEMGGSIMNGQFRGREEGTSITNQSGLPGIIREDSDLINKMNRLRELFDMIKSGRGTAVHSPTSDSSTSFGKFLSPS